jgi:hypothetical protein
MKLRRIAVLDCYTGAFGLFLFVSPWLFAYVSEEARVDIWTTGAAIAAISIAAIVAFSDWEEWTNLLLGLWLIVSLCPYAGDARHHSDRCVGLVLCRPRIMAGALRARLWSRAPNQIGRPRRLEPTPQMAKF